jgi:lipopolysaccharide heptosyltransferase I
VDRLRFQQGRTRKVAIAIAWNDTIHYNYLPMPEKFEDILIIKPSSLGDVVLALPALTALRKGFPDAKISWLIRPEFAPLIQNHPHLNDIILFDRKLLGKAWYQPRAAAALLSLIRDLRLHRFDAVFDFQGLFRTASIARLSGCRNRFGMKLSRELAHLFYTHKVPHDSDCIHLVDYYLKMTRIAGAAETTARFVLPIDPVAADSVNSKLAAHAVNEDNYAVLIPGSAHADKCWPVERFAALADKIHSHSGFSIVVTGTLQEKPVVKNLKSLSAAPIADFAGLTNLPELTALLKSAKLVVGNDTGPSHIAAALGKPLVMIFGRSNPARVAPYRRKHSVVAVEPWARGEKRNSTDTRHLISAVRFEDVYQKVVEQRCN